MPVRRDNRRTLASSVDLTHYGVSRVEAWVSVKINNKNMLRIPAPTRNLKSSKVGAVSHWQANHSRGGPLIEMTLIEQHTGTNRRWCPLVATPIAVWHWPVGFQ